MNALLRLARRIRLGLLVSALLSFASAGFYATGRLALGNCCLSLATTLYVLRDDDDDTEDDD